MLAKNLRAPAGGQAPRVIVDLQREQACPYRRGIYIADAMVSTRFNWVNGLDKRGSLDAKPSRRSA